MFTREKLSGTLGQVANTSFGVKTLGLGGIFKTEDRLTNFQNKMTLMGGQAQYQAAFDEASSLNEQADWAIRQSELQAGFQQRQVDITAGSQQQSYANGGVMTNMGTPLAMVESTRKIGALQVSMIRQAGQNEAKLYRSKANITERQGLSSLLSAQGQTTINSLQNQLTKQQQTQQALFGWMGMGVSLGTGLLSKI